MNVRNLVCKSTNRVLKSAELLEEMISVHLQYRFKTSFPLKNLFLAHGRLRKHATSLSPYPKAADNLLNFYQFGRPAQTSAARVHYKGKMQRQLKTAVKICFYYWVSFGVLPRKSWDSVEIHSDWIACLLHLETWNPNKVLLVVKVK